MLDKIIYFSIHNRLIISALVLGLVLAGIFALRRLPIDAVPDITNNQVQVITVSPALGASDMERLLTIPVELAMANLPNLAESRSISRFGLSIITLVFTDDTDAYWARQQVSERLGQLRGRIPPEIGQPELMPLTTGLGEIFQYLILPRQEADKKYSLADLRTLQDWLVRRALLGVEGVADVSSFGGEVKQYEVAVEPLRLQSTGVSIAEILQALGRSNQNTGGAYLTAPTQAYFIRTEGLVKRLEDLEQIVVRQGGNGLPILLRDVATVRFGSAIRYGALTHNAYGEAVGGIVLMRKGENSAAVVARVKARMAEIERTLPKDLSIHVFLDRTKLVNNAIYTVSQNLIEGALIVVFVLVLMLGNWRAGAIVASVIPLSMLFAVVMMNLFGVSGNLMSLGAIDFGLIVDGAVIIVEASLHHLHGKNPQEIDLKDEVYHSASQIRSSASFGELIIMLVYVPILTLAGVEGKMFQPLAQTVIFALLGAFILSMTYVPMMSAWFLHPKSNPKPSLADRMMRACQRVYTPVLHTALRFRIAVIGSALGLFLVALCLFWQLGGEFIPTLDEGDFAVEVRLRQGNSLSQTIQTTLKASEILRKEFPEIRETIGKIGSAEIPTDPMPVEACDLMLVLNDKSTWTNADSRVELAEKMQKSLEDKIIGVEFGFQQPIQMRFNELMTGFKQDVALKIYGDDLNTLALYAQRLAKLISPIAGVQDVYVEKVIGLPQVTIQYDRNALARAGLSVGEVNHTVNAAFAGAVAGQVYEQERAFDLVVRLAQTSRQHIEDVRNLRIHNTRGESFLLSSLANVSLISSAAQIQREAGRRRITVAFNVRERDVASVVADIQAKLTQQGFRLPEGYLLTYGGQFQNLQEAQARLALAVPLALALIFLLLYFTFHSVKQSLLIFAAIPMAGIGGVFALALRGMPFSISAGVGFIALFGVAVLNGMVLMGEFNRLRKSGLSDALEIIHQGTTTRLRPVLMTAAVASLGFLPMALSHGAGAEVQKPLATVVIGGLVSSTLLTLLVLPCLYATKGIRLPWASRLTLLVSALVISNTAQAQAPRSITLAEALELAEKQNLLLNAQNALVESQSTLQRTAREVSKTQVMWMGGQYNTINWDNNFTLTQSLPLPHVWYRRRELLLTQTQTAQIRRELSRQELRYQVRLAYTQWQYLLAQQLWLKREDSLARAWRKAVEVRYQSGEGNALEQNTAAAQAAEWQNLLRQNEHEQNIVQAQLQYLLHLNTPLIIADASLEKYALISHNSTDISHHPRSRLAYALAKQAEATTRLEKARFSPDITLGYFNQSLIGVQNVRGAERYFNGNYRFQGVQLGVAIPIFAMPYRARIRAAQLQTQAIQQEADAQQELLQSTWQQAQTRLQKARIQLEYYEQTALPTQSIIRQKARTAYQEGEIGYWEYYQAIRQAAATEAQYLIALRDYNAAVWEVLFLSENN